MNHSSFRSRSIVVAAACDCWIDDTFAFLLDTLDGYDGGCMQRLETI